MKYMIVSGHEQNGYPGHISNISDRTRGVQGVFSLTAVKVDVKQRLYVVLAETTTFLHNGVYTRESTLLLLFLLPILFR